MKSIEEMGAKGALDEKTLAWYIIGLEIPMNAAL